MAPRPPPQQPRAQLGQNRAGETPSAPGCERGKHKARPSLGALSAPPYFHFRFAEARRGQSGKATPRRGPLRDRALLPARSPPKTGAPHLQGPSRRQLLQQEQHFPALPSAAAALPRPGGAHEQGQRPRLSPQEPEGSIPGPAARPGGCLMES